MRRSTFVTIGLVALGGIVATFVIRGTTRFLIGERGSLLLAAPIAFVSLVLLIVLLAVAIGEVTGLYPMTDDLDEQA